MRRTALAFMAMWILGCPGEAPIGTLPPDQGSGDSGGDAFVPIPDDAGDGATDDLGMAITDFGPPPPCPSGLLCDDGDPCTTQDRCADDECVGKPYSCDDNLECTVSRCDGQGGCGSPELVAGDWCLISGACVPDGSLSPTDPCLACVTPLSSVAWSASDGAPCDDGLLCTAEDQCIGGVCQGAKEACEDDNPCTTNGCKEDGGCIHAAIQGACEDGDFCTTGDFCNAKACLPGPSTLNCDDGDQCTADMCDGDGGCAHPVHNQTCDDGNPCTVGDVCALGKCAAGPSAAECNDDNACTDDTCLHGIGCRYIPNLNPCVDDDPCSLGDSCSGGECVSGFFKLECNDSDPCTNDVCEAFKGCSFIPQFGGPCDDGNACTVDETCDGGDCVGQQVAVCNDDNACTDDVCNVNQGTGCEFVPNDNLCDDGNPCTLNDRCTAGSCQADLAECDDGLTCTVDTCMGDEGCVHAVNPASDACRLSIRIISPQRAAMLTGNKTISIKGIVSPVSMLDAAELNGIPLSVKKDGTFTTTVKANSGMNMLAAEATDKVGNTDRSVRAFFYSTQYKPMDHTKPKQSAMDQGLYLFLGPQAIDDGVHDKSDPNDLGTIFEILLGSFDVGALLPNPVVDSDNYAVTIKNVTYNAPTVQLTPIPEGLSLYASIKNFKADVVADGKCFFCPSASGDISISQIIIIADISISVDSNDKVKAKLLSTDVLLVNPDVDINGVLGFIFDFLVDFIVNQFAPTIEDAFKQEMGNQIPKLLEDALGSLAFDVPFPIGPFFDGGKKVNVNLKTGLDDTFWNDDGGTLVMWGAMTAPKTIQHNAPGVLRRAACASGGVENLALTQEDPLQVALSDDVLNMLFYSLWQNGGLSFPVPSDLLVGGDLTGITDLVLDVDFRAPPVVSSCNVNDDLLMQLGDIEITATGKLFGSDIELSIFASAAAYLDLAADADGLGFAISDILFVDADVIIKTPGLASAEGTVYDLLNTTLTPFLFQQLAGGDALGSFPLPEIDLGGALPGIPEGTIIAVNPKKVFRSQGWTVISGGIK